MHLTAQHRQRIIDGYLAETGRNMFIPGEFVDWLTDKPSHPAYRIFFGKTDQEAAREHRIGLARSMASGLRITVHSETQTAQVVQVVTRKYPALISPMAGRSMGGGYTPFDPSDPAAMAEIRRQACTSLQSWLNRYRGVAESAGVDLRFIEDACRALDVPLADAG